MIGDLEPAVSVAGARRALATAFREAGLDTPELDARLLVGHALGLLPRGVSAASRWPASSAPKSSGACRS